MISGAKFSFDNFFTAILVDFKNGAKYCNLDKSKTFLTFEKLVLLVTNELPLLTLALVLLADNPTR